MSKQITLETAIGASSLKEELEQMIARGVGVVQGGPRASSRHAEPADGRDSGDNCHGRGPMDAGRAYGLPSAVFDLP